MIRRTYDPTFLEKSAESYKDTLVNFDSEKLVNNFLNITLVNEHGDVALFEYDSNGDYEGHYFFVRRGPAALRTGKEMLEKVFSGEFDVNRIVGYTPHDNSSALRMNKALGFSYLHTVEMLGDAYHVFELTKEQYKGLLNE
jgi:hypothetical protein